MRTVTKPKLKTHIIGGWRKTPASSRIILFSWENSLESAFLLSGASWCLWKLGKTNPGRQQYSSRPNNSEHWQQAPHPRKTLPPQLSSWPPQEYRHPLFLAHKSSYHDSSASLANQYLLDVLLGWGSNLYAPH